MINYIKSILVTGNKTKNIILDILFPPICLNCQKYLKNKNKFICDNCFNAIKFNNTLFCPVCRARLADGKKICHYDTLYLLAAAGNYDDVILRNLIHYFKYKSFKNLAPVLGEIILKYFKTCRLWPASAAKRGERASPLAGNLKLETYLIVPIPLHSRRERERGFNQAKLIAKIIACHLNLLFVNGLERIKNNKPQANLKDNEARIKNMTNCFKIKNPELIKGKNIILVDDVFTSGATINEAVKILKENGAKKIIALVIAKA